MYDDGFSANVQISHDREQFVCQPGSFFKFHRFDLCNRNVTCEAKSRKKHGQHGKKRLYLLVGITYHSSLIVNNHDEIFSMTKPHKIPMNLKPLE